MKPSRHMPPPGDFELTGMDMFQAMQEVAFEQGGERLKEEVVDAAFADYGVLPGPQGLIILETAAPGCAAEVMERMEAVQKARFAEEYAALFGRRAQMKRWGRALIKTRLLS